MADSSSPVVAAIDRSDGRVVFLEPFPSADPVAGLARKADGSWVYGWFSPEDVHENFQLVMDSAEAAALFKEATMAASSNPDLLTASLQAL